MYAILIDVEKTGSIRARVGDTQARTGLYRSGRVIPASPTTVLRPAVMVGTCTAQGVALLGGVA